MIDSVREYFYPYFETDYPLISLGIALSALMIGFIAHVVVYQIIRTLSKHRASPVWAVVYKRTFHSARFLFMLVVFLLAKPFLQVTAELLPYLNHFLSIAMVIILAWALMNTVMVTREIFLSHYDIDKKNNLHARKVYTQFSLLANILRFLIVVLATGIALMTFDSIRQFGVSILASAGIAGIILGFAAQKLIATILAGLQLAITQPIRIQDVVIVEGEWGTIENMTLTYVVIKIWDKRRLVVPTTYFIEKPFQNWTRVSSDILGTVYLYTDYTLPVESLRRELTRVLEATDLWDGNVNVLQVTDSKERTMELRALMSAEDSSVAWDLRVHVREKLITYIQENHPNSLPRTRIEMEGDHEAYQKRDFI